MISHTELKKKALSKPGVKIAYDALADEYMLARELLTMRPTSYRSRSRPSFKVNNCAIIVKRQLELPLSPTMSTSSSMST